MQWREDSAPGRGGVRLHVRRVVDPAAPPVLLLHGLGVGGSVWQSFARRLLPHLAAVAPDLRGHGQSDAPPSGYAPADYAGDLIELLGDGLETPLPVVGHSLGALVALKLAELRPDLVVWLVLLDPPLDPDLRNAEVADVYALRHAPPASSRSTCSVATRAAASCWPRAWRDCSARPATPRSKPWRRRRRSTVPRRRATASWCCRPIPRTAGFWAMRPPGRSWRVWRRVGSKRSTARPTRCTPATRPKWRARSSTLAATPRRLLLRRV